MTSIFEGFSPPQNKALSNQNKGHLGSRYIWCSVAHPPPPPCGWVMVPPPPLWLWGCGGALLVSDAADFLWFLVPPPPPVDVWMGHGGGGGAGSMYINIYVYMNISICICI